MTLKQKLANSEFRQVFNLKTPERRGACLLLSYYTINSFSAALINGVFYTVFMAQNGIDIVRIGILGTIPSLCWLLSLFTPKLMQKFRRRKGILFFAHMFNYTCTLLATTIMPLFISDYMQRTIWFGILLLVGNLPTALFSSGVTQWHLHFIPSDDHLRNVYYSYINMGSLIATTVTNIAASLVADVLAGSPMEAPFINALRYIAYGIFVFCGILVFLMPKEYPYPKVEKQIRLLDVLYLPFKEKKYLMTAAIIFLWTFMTSTNSSTWTYYLKETAGISYLLIYLSGIVTMITNILLLPWFRRLIRRYSMPTMLCLGILGMALNQLSLSFVMPGTSFYYALVSIPNGMLWSLINLCTATAFVYNLPEANQDVHVVFWNMMTQVATFLGIGFGAWFLDLLGEGVVLHLFGIDFYGSQILMWFKFIANVSLAFFVAKLTPRIRHASDSHANETV